MTRQKTNPNFVHISLLVPKRFLQRFDDAMQGFFPSRSEAVGRGMDHILQEVKGSKEEADG